MYCVLWWTQYLYKCIFSQNGALGGLCIHPVYPTLTLCLCSCAHPHVEHSEDQMLHISLWLVTLTDLSGFREIQPLVKMLIWQWEPSPIPRVKLPFTSVEAGPRTTFSLLTAAHEVMHNVTRGFSSDSKVKWKVYPCLNHKRKLLVLAEYLGRMACHKHSNLFSHKIPRIAEKGCDAIK